MSLLNKGMKVLMAGLLAVSLGSFAAAFPQGAANVTSVMVSPMINDAAFNSGVSAGNIASVNLNANSQSNYWSAAFGNVSGSIQLRDDTSKKTVFTWNANLGGGSTIKNKASLIATTNNVLNLPNLGVGAPGTYDAIGVTGQNSDSFAATFTQNSAPNIKVGNRIVGNNVANSAVNLNYYDNNHALRQDGQNLGQETLMNDTTSNFVFLAVASPNNVPTFAYDNVTQVNYEMLLYSNNFGNNNPTNYNFFLELT